MSGVCRFSHQNQIGPPRHEPKCGGQAHWRSLRLQRRGPLALAAHDKNGDFRIAMVVNLLQAESGATASLGARRPRAFLDQSSIQEQGSGAMMFRRIGGGPFCAGTATSPTPAALGVVNSLHSWPWSVPRKVARAGSDFERAAANGRFRTIEPKCPLCNCAAVMSKRLQDKICLVTGASGRSLPASSR
jgi:hypothetical protein